MRPHLIALLIPLAGFTGCDDGPGDPGNDCNADTLPLSASADAPTIVAVRLEVEANGILFLVTATDPQGTSNLLDVVQSVGIFPDRLCEGTPVVRTDDLAGSGVEESFGIVVDPAVDLALYGAIAAASSWPVEVDFEDGDGNRTFGRVFAIVVP